MNVLFIPQFLNLNEYYEPGPVQSVGYNNE